MLVKPTLTIYLDKRRERKDKTYPVKLRVTYKRERKYYSINNISLTEDVFKNKVMKDTPRGKYREIREELEDFKKEADKIIDKMSVFSFDQFNELGRVKPATKKDVFSLFDNYITALRENEQEGTAQSYIYARNSLKEFHKKSTLPFENVTVDFLKKYEKEMLANDRSITTVGIYLRNLRAIMNLAKKDGLTSNYPFGKEKDGLFQIRSGRARHKALSTKELIKLLKYTPDNEIEAYHLDIWLFSYLTNGMNVKDICFLKYKNLINNEICFIRQKTKNTTKEVEQIKIPISPQIRDIIDKWSNPRIDEHTYLFPVLSSEKTEEQILKRTKQFTKQINKYVGRIAKKLGIEQTVTTYSSRHSSTTQLLRQEVPIDYIRRQLGHKHLSTTISYLGDFEDDKRIDYQNRLTNFNDKSKNEQNNE